MAGNNTCNSCNGSGKERCSCYGDDNCRYCGGNGETTCITCNGSGTIYVDEWINDPFGINGR